MNSKLVVFGSVDGIYFYPKFEEITHFIVLH